jgi:lysophospholipase L1-like esterase
MGARKAMTRHLVGLILFALTSSAWAGPRIVLVGDSTVTDKAGWGVGFKQLLGDGVESSNTSLGGRSSKSFRDEGHWDKMIAAGGDYVLIQFGHNDQPGKGSARETTLDQFRANMKRYAEEARATGMKPILVTPLTRREFKEDGKIHSSLAGHAQIVKEVAAELDVPLIDLHKRSLAVCDAMGKEACIAVLSTTKPDGTFDGTHLTPAGSMLFGAIVATELKTVVPALSPHIRAVPSTQPAMAVTK